MLHLLKLTKCRKQSSKVDAIFIRNKQICQLLVETTTKIMCLKPSVDMYFLELYTCLSIKIHTYNSLTWHDKVKHLILKLVLFVYIIELLHRFNFNKHENRHNITPVTKHKPTNDSQLNKISASFYASIRTTCGLDYCVRHNIMSKVVQG